jgi:hypothetical protein
VSRVTRDYPRQADEEYNTPPWVAVPIAMWLAGQAVRSIWEPAPGRGQLGRALVACGFSVIETRSDFLDTGTCWPSDRDALVTNPPYGKRGELAEQFIRHAVLGLRAPIAAFLLRVDYDSAKTRRDIFGDCPFFAGKIVLLDRIVWFEREGAAGPSENHAWFIWSRFGATYSKGRPWTIYGGKPDEDRPRKVDHTDPRRDRRRRPGRGVASAARDPEREEG